LHQCGMNPPTDLPRLGILGWGVRDPGGHIPESGRGQCRSLASFGRLTFGRPVRSWTPARHSERHAMRIDSLQAAASSASLHPVPTQACQSQAPGPVVGTSTTKSRRKVGCRRARVPSRFWRGLHAGSRGSTSCCSGSARSRIWCPFHCPLDTLMCQTATEAALGTSGGFHRASATCPTHDPITVSSWTQHRTWVVTSLEVWYLGTSPLPPPVRANRFGGMFGRRPG
jgi:hypothetical protein